MVSSSEGGMMNMVSSPKVAETALELTATREEPIARDYGDAAPARGIVIGIVISALFWAAIIAALI